VLESVDKKVKATRAIEEIEEKMMIEITNYEVFEQ
jgi:hypothetical protein